MRGEMCGRAAVSCLMEQIDRPDPCVVHRERENLKAFLGARLETQLRAQYDRVSACAHDAPGSRGARRMKTQALAYLAASDPGLAANLAMRPYRATANMKNGKEPCGGRGGQEG